MTSKDLRFLAVVALWGICTACNGCFGCKSPVDQPGSTLSKSCDEMAPLLKPQQLDVLFVIDNSNSMREEQEGVAKELTSFVDQLRVAGGVAQDIRVGVITTTVYLRQKAGGRDDFFDCPSKGWYCTQSGKLQPVPDASPDGGVVLGTGSERVLNSDDPEFVAKFARLVQQGVYGSGQETPFEALRIALTDQLGTPVEQGGNGGFLRDGARLLIVVMSDEDDCSEDNVRPPKVFVGDQPDVDYCGGANANLLTPVAQYHDIIAGVKDSKGNLKDIIYTAIAPVSNDGTKTAQAIIDQSSVPPALRNKDCPTSNGAGVRHRAMAEMFFSDLSNLDSICKTSYKDTLIAIANLAGVSQTIDLEGVPDPHVLQLIITRKDGTLQTCTVDNGGIEAVEPATADNPVTRLHLGSTCKRRRDDQLVQVQRLCIF